uniref:F-box domain-containing protein n=1 Tax=Mycena chlorophos TaxID=658473 RepID=A0ABQ0LU12_MYCCL|nr:predicted protein [Mycena chlorophos]
MATSQPLITKFFGPLGSSPPPRRRALYARRKIDSFAVRDDDLLITDYFRPVVSPTLPRPIFAEVELLLDLLCTFKASHTIDILRSNSPPTDQQRAESRPVLNRLQNESNAISDELRRLKVTVARLNAEARCWRMLQGRLDASMETYRSIVSPIRRMPDEILAEIFTQCVAQDRHPLSSDHSFSLLRIVRVCRRWRAVAFASPRLWRHINDDCHIRHAGIDAAYILPSSAIIQRCRLHLQHSGHHIPLSITCFFPFDADFLFDELEDEEAEQEVDDISNFLDELFPTSARWQSLNLRYNPAELQGFADRAREHDAQFPLLETVAVIVRSEPHHWPEPPERLPLLFSSFLDSLPALRRLSMMNCDVAWDDLGFSRTSTSWGRLQICHLQHCLGEHILNILPSFSPGAVLRLDAAVFDAPLGTNQRRAIQTAIGTLSLRECDQNLFTRPLLEAIIAPHLTTLEIWSRGRRGFIGPQTISAISTCAEQSSCKMKRLVLGSELGSTDNSWDLLSAFFRSQSCRHLFELVLNSKFASLRLLRMLSASEDVLEGLSRLGVSCWRQGIDRLDEEAIVAFHKSRPRLRQLWVDGLWASDVSRATHRALQDNGLMLVMASYRCSSTHDLDND